MRSALTMAATIAALGLMTTSAVMAQSDAGQTGSVYVPQQLSSIESQLQADAAAIQQDKTQMDRDQQAGNQAVVTHDKRQLYQDTEQQEYDRGIAEDHSGGKSKGW